MKKQRVVRGILVEEGSGNVYADLGYAEGNAILWRPGDSPGT